MARPGSRVFRPAGRAILFLFAGDLSCGRSLRRDYFAAARFFSISSQFTTFHQASM
jgi:hypothetical protein